MSQNAAVYVIGAGGHAKVVIRAVQATGRTVARIFDDDPGRCGSSLLGVPVSGPVERIREYPRQPTIIAIGDNATRRRIAETYELPAITIVHPQAFVDSSAHLGPGTVILARAIVQVDSCLGDHVIVNHAATVDHDCVVGDYAHLAPGVHLAGGVTVEDGVLIGINAAVIPGTRIGRDTTVGAGAAVAQDLPAYAVAVGVPAKVMRLQRPQFRAA
jgi:sugar O-acyltransferase (sialic acid O-acetyltransferase NeuD family)